MLESCEIAILVSIAIIETTLKNMIDNFIFDDFLICWFFLTTGQRKYTITGNERKIEILLDGAANAYCQDKVGIGRGLPSLSTAT